MSGLAEWVIFLSLSAVSVVMAALMLLTMSMYRAGLALMSSFVALAGLFILLDADLMALIQLMMNVGGMMVMILFMVMMMIDPGGEMMWEMKRKMNLPGPGAFSMSMPREEPQEEETVRMNGKAEAAKKSDWTCPMHPGVSELGPGDCPKCGMPLVQRSELVSEDSAADQPPSYTCPMHAEIKQDHPGQCPICGMDLVAPEEQQPPQSSENVSTTYTCPMHPEVQQPEPGTCPKCGMELVVTQSQTRAASLHGKDEPDGVKEYQGAMQGMSMAGMSPRQHYRMMVDMAMSTRQLPWAIAVGAASSLVLVVVMIRTAWPLSGTEPTQDATVAVGELLLSRYMIGFEGAAFLILSGMVGAVIFAKREREQSKQKVAAKDSNQKSSAPIYTCPMHPEVQQQGPGTCPKCGMELVPIAQVLGTSPTEHGDPK